MRKSTICADFSSDVETVWDVVTNNHDFTWRSDLADITVLNEKCFVEYTKQGIATKFTITCKQPYTRYEFDMENENLGGHWSGSFTPLPNGGTRIEFTEEVTIKKRWMQVMSVLLRSLKRMQKTYVSDLRMALNE